MAQFSNERTTTENSSDPLKFEHGGREEPQKQGWPTPSAPATFQTKETQVADDQRHDEHADEVQQSPKKSVLQKVKDRAKTYIHKHGYGHIHNDHKENEEKEEKQGEKKENAEDLNSNSSNRSSDVGSAVSPGSDASSARNLSNESEATRDREVTNTGIPWKPRDPNVVSEGFEPRTASDRPPSPVETARGSAVPPGSDASSARNLSNESKATRDREVTNTGIPWKPRDPNVVSEGFEPRTASDRPPSPVETARGSAVSPGSDASSARNLSNESEATRDREVTNTGIPWKPRDPNVVSEGFEPRTASDRPPSPVETARGEQELPTTPDQQSPGITPTLQSPSAVITPTPTLQSTEATSTPLETQQVHDIGTTDTADLATHPVQGEFSQELPNLVPYNRRKETPEVEFYGKDEPEKIDYNDPFPRSPRDSEAMMKSITEEPTVETLPVQQAAEDRWFDADDVVAGTPPVKDQDPSLNHLGSEKFGTTEPISDETEYTDQDKLGSTGIKMHDDVSDESQDLRAQEASSEEFNENTGRSGALENATSIEGSKDKTAMNLGGVGLHENEKEEERKDEEGAGDDESHMEKLIGITPTENNANVASKRGNDEHISVDEAPSEPERIAEEEKYENSEKGKSYEDPVYDIDSTEKNEISSKLGYGEDQEPEQEETEKRTDQKPIADDEKGAHEETDIDSTEKNEISSKLGYGEHQEPEQEESEKRTEKRTADDEKGAHEESGKSLTDTPSAAESVVSSNPAVQEKDEGQTTERYGDDEDEKTKSDGHEDTDAGKSYSDKMYASANTAKNAFFSTFGYGAKPVQAEQIQPTEIKE